MHSLRLLSLLLFLACAASVASAQETWVTGPYRMKFTIGTTTYRMTLNGYRISDSVRGTRVNARMALATAIRRIGLSSEASWRLVRNVRNGSRSADGTDALPL